MLGSLARMRRTRAGRKQVRIMRATVFLVAAATMGLVSAHTSALASAARDAARYRPTRTSATAAARAGASSASSTPPTCSAASQNKSGFFMLHVVGVLYTFVAIAIVCDDFFVPALEVLVRAGYEPSTNDVAGATFIGRGRVRAGALHRRSSACSSRRATSGSARSSAARCFKRALRQSARARFSSRETSWSLTWWPLARDCAFYVLDLMRCCTCSLQDEKIAMWRSGLMLFFYVMYVIFMKFNARVETWVKVKVLKQTDFVKEVSRNLGHNENAKHGDGGKPKGNQVSPLPKGKGPVNESAETTRAARSPRTGDGVGGCRGAADEAENLAAVLEEHREARRRRRGGRRRRRRGDRPLVAGGQSRADLLVIAAPLMYLFYYTVPNCKKKTHLFMVVFFESIFYIGFFSYFMVWWATVVADVLGIDDVVMGYTILAAGTSVPDLLSSVIVARQGLGDMAVSSSIGFKHLRHHVRSPASVAAVVRRAQRESDDREQRIPGVRADASHHHDRLHHFDHRFLQVADDEIFGRVHGVLIRRVSRARRDGGLRRHPTDSDARRAAKGRNSSRGGVSCFDGALLIVFLLFVNTVRTRRLS